MARSDNDGPEVEGTAAQQQPLQSEPSSENLIPQAPLDKHWDNSVADWVSTHLRNSPVAQATEAWNHLMQKLPKLKDILHKNMGS